MIYSSVVDCIGHTPLVYLDRLFPQPGVRVIAKLECLNPGGSMKDRSARFIIEHGLRAGTITDHSHLIESSSGNFGIAVAMVARIYNLAFTCVVDPCISPMNLRMMAYLGANIEMVNTPDDQGGYLQSRIRRVQELQKMIPYSQWINQYANQLNWQAHFHDTAVEIITDLDEPIDGIVVAVSTAGTIMGLARRLRKTFPHLKVFAVDVAGSIIFGAPAGPRRIPGIGASRVPEILCKDEIDQVIYVCDQETIQGCLDLVSYEGIFAGGSSGSVIAAIQKLAFQLPASSCLLTLLPDRGERYLDLIYQRPLTVDLDACHSVAVGRAPWPSSVSTRQP